MFKGKVKIIKKVDGKEEVIEKEFNSEQEYRQFVQEHGLASGAGFSLPDIKLSLPEWGALSRLIERCV